MKKIVLSTLFCTTTLFQAEAFAAERLGEQTPDVVKTKMKNLHEKGHFRGDSPFTKGVKEQVFKDKFKQEAKQEEHEATARKLFTTKIKDYQEKNEIITNEMKALRDNNEELRTTLDTSKAELENLREKNLQISETCETLEAKKSEIEIELQKTTDSRTRNVTYLQSELSKTIQALATAKAELAASEDHIKAIEKAQEEQIKKLEEAKQNKKDDQQKGSPDGDEGKKAQSSDKTTSSSSTQGNGSAPSQSDDDSDYNSDDDVNVNIRGK